MQKTIKIININRVFLDDEGHVIIREVIKEISEIINRFIAQMEYRLRVKKLEIKFYGSNGMPIDEIRDLNDQIRLTFWYE